MGVPGCPEFAACTASIARVRIVSMQSVSSGFFSVLLVKGAPAAVVMVASLRWESRMRLRGFCDRRAFDDSAPAGVRRYRERARRRIFGRSNAERGETP